MKKEARSQSSVSVGVDPMWKSLKDLVSIVPKIKPNLVKRVEITEGDGGLGTVFLFTFDSGVPMMKFQKEKIVEFDESLHRIGLQVMEGHLELGFSFYKVTSQLTATEETTQVDILVEYEVNKEEVDDEAASMALRTTASAISFIKTIEKYILQTNNSC